MELEFVINYSSPTKGYEVYLNMVIAFCQAQILTLISCGSIYLFSTAVKFCPKEEGFLSRVLGAFIFVGNLLSVSFGKFRQLASG